MFFNLTPHSIFIEGFGEILPLGKVARLEEFSYEKGNINGVTIVYKQFGNIIDLPERHPDYYYIVSALCAQKAWEMGRDDVFCPGDPIRDEKGRIVGCRSLCGMPPLKLCSFCGHYRGEGWFCQHCDAE